MDGSRCCLRDYSPSNNDNQRDAVVNNIPALSGSKASPSKAPYNLRSRSPKRIRSSTSPKNLRRFSSSSVTIYHRPPKRFRPSNKPEDAKTIVQSSDIEVGIAPLNIMRSVRFSDVGGLEQHIEELKEMVLLPRLFPELSKHISSPRGVLFYGPPGTGKTLVARALASEFSRGNCKTTFFARKGADCLSKWLGESEKHLCQLFEKAQAMRPSIIFFDEIDGLAPSRSQVQDHVQHSIVTTLLALMDGLEDRGEVIVIGATNRIEAIDPALRRPGRFDREFYFPLPSLEKRLNIIRIHTKKWNPPISEELMKKIALDTAGYCGADLKALCTEATLVCLRRCYPNLCSLENTTLDRRNTLVVLPNDFKRAITKIVPAMQRKSTLSFKPIPSNVKVLLQDSFSKIISKVDAIFGSIKNDKKCQVYNVDLPSIYHPRILITGKKDRGQTRYIAPAILHYLENIPHHTIDLPNICSSFEHNVEGCCVQIFQEAKTHTPSIIYFPTIENTWDVFNYTQQQNLLLLLRDIPSEAPIMVLATSDCSFENLPSGIKELFDTKDVVVMESPTFEERWQFFEELLNKIRVIPGDKGKHVTLKDAGTFSLNETAHGAVNQHCLYSAVEKPVPKLCLNEKRLKSIQRRLVALTANCTIPRMEKLGNYIANLIYNRRNEADKTMLLDSIEQEIQNSRVARECRDK